MPQNPGNFVDSDEFGIPSFVTDDLYDTVGGTIGTSEGIEASISLAIPTSWNEYNLRCKANGRIGSASARVVTHQLRKTNVAGTSGGISSTTVGNAAPSNNQPFMLGGKWTGETATGNITVVLTMISTVDALGSWDDIFMEIWAFRVS